MAPSSARCPSSCWPGHLRMRGEAPGAGRLPPARALCRPVAARGSLQLFTTYVFPPGIRPSMKLLGDFPASPSLFLWEVAAERLHEGKRDPGESSLTSIFALFQFARVGLGPGQEVTEAESRFLDAGQSWMVAVSRRQTNSVLHSPLRADTPDASRETAPCRGRAPCPCRKGHD